MQVTKHLRGSQRLLVAAIRTAFLAGAALGPLANAATITVTDGGDAGTVSTCTLRQAIESANADAAGNSSCAAGSGADTIVFDAAVSQITLATGELLLSDAQKMTISGGASGATIDANHASRVFHVALGAQAAFDHLTIQHGTAGAVANGGGIYCEGALDITSSTLSGNSAPSGNGGGIEAAPSCSLTLTDSTVSDNSSDQAGAGIRSAGALTIATSTFSGNISQISGGGIQLRGGQATITDTTISGNQAFSQGGGIESDFASLTLARSTLAANYSGIGSALFNRSASFTMTNTTVASSAPQAISTDSGGATQTLTNCTLSGSGIQIKTFSGNAPTLVNSILARTDAGANCAAAVIDGGGNLETGSSCGFGVNSLSNAIAALGPLTDNGGLTLTMMPGPAGAAIDAIACSAAPATDQRGVARPQGAKCDVGAVEVGLGLNVSDGKAFGFYGATIQFVVTLQNKSATDPVSNIHVTGFGSAELDATATSWICTVGDCTTALTFGAFDDTANLAAGSSLTWLVSLPVKPDTQASSATFTVNATGAPTSSDTDTLAIFRATFEAH